MWKLLRQITGALWLAFGVGFIAADMLELARSEALGWSYYLAAWSYLLLCVAAGALLLTGIVRARWLVTLLAALLGIYAVSLLGKFEGAAVLPQLWCFAMLAFAVWSIYLVQRRNA